MMNTNTTYIASTTAKVSGWGSKKSARRVSGLSAYERALIRAGETLIIEGCPPYKGETRRRIIEVSGKFYCRMP